MSLKNTTSYKTASGATSARKTALGLLLFTEEFPLVILLLYDFFQSTKKIRQTLHSCGPDELLCLETKVVKKAGKAANVSQLSVLTSLNLIRFHACSHYRPDKTATLSNICLLGRACWLFIQLEVRWHSAHTRANKSISGAIMSNRVCFKV